MTVAPTYRPALGRRYRRPGGPWDVPPLLDLLDLGRGHAMVDPDRALDAAAITRASAAVAAGLHARGVRRGEAVVWQLPNVAESVLLYRACWQLGAVAAPIHHRASPHELRQRAEAVGARVAISSSAEVASMLDLTPHVGRHARPSDPAVVLFTAGSTGAPKGVIHTHRTLGSKAVQMVAVHGIRRTDAVLMPAPLAHVSGLLNGILVPGIAGIPSILQPRWDPDEALDLIAARSVTFMVGPPTFFVAMADAPGFTAAKVRSLRLVSTGGAGVTPAFVVDASRRFGARFKRTYGSTEAPTITTSTARHGPARAATTDGRPFGDTELRIAPDGELLVRGPEVCAGYLDPAHTAAAFARGGWFRTGDLATLDGEGWLTITGRKKDIIIRAGENISAAAVESTLEAHPAVRHAAVVGQADDRLGERVVAFVVADATFDLAECQRWFGQQGVARFTTPERVIRLPSLPTLAAGKVDKAALRRQITD